MSVTLQQLPPTPAVLDSAFDGVRIGARSYIAAAFYDAHQVPRGDGGWRSQGHVDCAFVHQEFPEHVAWWDEYEAAWTVIQRFRREPNHHQLGAAAASVFRVSAAPEELVILPLRLRLPLDVEAVIASGGGQAPVAGAAVYQSWHEGVPTCTRLYAGTRVGHAPRFCVELLVGDFPARRSKVYVPDGRRLRALRGKRVQAFVSSAIDGMLAAASFYSRHYGLTPSTTAPLGGRVFAALHAVGGVNGVVADVEMPTIDGATRYLTATRPLRFQPIRTDDERELILAHLCAGGA